MAHVLIVDDDRDLLNLATMQLERYGHRVSTASDAESALWFLATRETPDVAVLDHAMPGMTGLELLLVVRQHAETRTVPVILLSAAMTFEDIDAGRALGAYFLPKPYIAEVLTDAIDLVA